MAARVSCLCPHCQRIITRSTDADADKRLTCPHCQQVIARSGDEVATLTTGPEGELPQRETATPGSSAQQGTLTLDQPPAGAVKAGAPEVAPLPEKVGRFEIRRELGEGAFGKVYEAYDPQLDRAVAIKVAKLDRGDAAQRVKRFLREAKAAAGLRHPHIVPVHEFGQEGDQFYIVSLFIKGQTLESDLVQRKDQKAPVDLQRAARIVRQLAEALAYAHSQGIVHRDVKPANVMLDDKDEPMLMDFGLATRQDEAEKLTHAGAVLGTPLYMAPEQARGKGAEPVPASDQYSLGVVLYEMIAGMPPFEGPPELVMFHQMDTEPASPRKHDAAISRDLETICLKCLEKDAVKRYRDCRDFADDLQRYLDGEPVHARPVGSVERVGRWCGRNPALAATSVLAIASLVVGMVVSLCLLIVANNRADAEAKAKDIANEKTEAEKKARDQVTKTAGELSIALGVVKKQSEEAKTQAALLQMEKGLAMCDRGEVAHGMHWLGLSLRTAPVENEEIQLALRTSLPAWKGRLFGIAQNPPMPHSGMRIRDMAFTRDGTTLVSFVDRPSARGRGGIVLWQCNSGRMTSFHPVSMYSGSTHSGIGQVSRLSGDGLRAIDLMGEKDGDTHVFDLKFIETASGSASTPYRLGSYKELQQVGPAVLSSDGTLAVVHMNIRKDQPSIAEFSTAMGKPLRESWRIQGMTRVNVLALSPDNKTLFVSGEQQPGRSGGQLFELSTGKPTGPFMESQVGHSFAEFSPDGKTLLVCTNKCLLLDVATCKPLHLPFSHDKPGSVTSGAFSPDGTLVVTGSADKTAYLWEVRSGRRLGPPIEHASEVCAVAFHPDGKSLVTGCVDGMARFWDIDSELRTSSKADHVWFPAVQALFSPDSKHVLVIDRDVPGGVGYRARLLESDSGRPAAEVVSQKGNVIVTLLPADQNVLIVQDDYTTVSAQFWNPVLKQSVGTPRKLQDRLRDSNPIRAAVHPDGKTLLCLTATFGAEYGTIKACDLTTGEVVESPLVLPSEVVAMAFSPDGKRILIGCMDGKARLWDAATWKLIGQPFVHQGPIRVVAFRHDGKVILTAGDDRLVQLWDAHTGAPIGAPLKHAAPVTTAVFSPDGRMILTGCTDRSTRYWETSHGWPLGPPRYHSAPIKSVAFSADGNTVLIVDTGEIGRVIKAPRALQGTPDQIHRWLEVVTRMEMDRDGTARNLDDATWRSRRDEFEKLGALDDQAWLAKSRVLRVKEKAEQERIAHEKQEAAKKAAELERVAREKQKAELERTTGAKQRAELERIARGNFTNSIGIKFVWIPSGSFMMGSPLHEKQRMGDVETQHTVKLSKGFYMGVYAVTQEQWNEIMGTNPSAFTGFENLPVDSVSWNDCQEFIKKLRDKDKKAYRLPSETEWEYACRAGTTSAFNFGDAISPDQANYGTNFIHVNGKKAELRSRSAPVGSYPANAWGLHDMHGNVVQWCQDWFGAYPQNDVVDPLGPDIGKVRVLRGGSWNNHSEHCRSAYRIGREPGSRNPEFGFRVCFSLE